MRLIDADALIALIEKRLINTAIIGWLCRIISEVPTIEVEPVRYGRWIAREYDDGFGSYKMYHCSECDTREANPEKFCRECGVRMFLGGTYGEEQ